MQLTITWELLLSYKYHHLLTVLSTNGAIQQICYNPVIQQYQLFPLILRAPPLQCREGINLFSASPIFGQVQKFFLENLLLARFLCWRDLSRDLFFREDFELFLHINMKTLKNQARNEIFRKMTMTLTLIQNVYLRPMDAKGLRTPQTLHKQLEPKSNLQTRGKEMESKFHPSKQMIWKDTTCPSSCAKRKNEVIIKNLFPSQTQQGALTPLTTMRNTS